jgi:DNA invertase Pin-like site-specific DNA recombinase
MSRSQSSETAPVPAIAIYARFSVNPDDSSESTRVQLKKGQEEARRRWPGCVIRKYEDDNYSGTTEERPGYQELLSDIRRKQVTHVLTKNQSRIARDTQIWDRFRITCLAAGVDELDTWTEGTVSHVAGRSLPGRIMALFDAEYVEKVRVNVLDALAVYAKEGRAPGGVCLGYQRAEVPVLIGGETRKIRTLVPDPEWVPVIQEAFASLLAGVHMAEIARQFNRKGLPTPRNGAKWRPSNLRRLLVSPTLTALRVHVTEARRKELRAQGIHYLTLKMAREYGNVYEGLWEPIIDRDTFLAVQKLLDEPGTVVMPDGRTVRRGIRRGPIARYLLSNYGRCGKCKKANVTGSARKGKKSLYVCHSSNGGCNGLGITMDVADGEFERQFLQYLEATEYREALAAGDPYAEQRLALVRKMDAIDARREQDEEDELLGNMSRDTFLRRAKKAEALKLDLTSQLMALPQPVETIDPDAILLAWPEATVAEKRQIMALVLDYVDILPAQDGGNRVRVHMKGWAA